MADKMERKQLLEYLPSFMQEFFEMKEIMKTEDVEMDVIDTGIEKVLDNAFIQDCDEYGIKKYETLLSIMPSSQDTLESRKSRVFLRWNDDIPYTYRVLIRKLNAFCGVNNYTLTGDESAYYLHFETSLGLFGQVKELEEMLEKMLPVNIFYELSNNLECEACSSVNLAGGVCFVTKITVNSSDQSINNNAEVNFINEN